MNKFMRFASAMSVLLFDMRSEDLGNDKGYRISWEDKHGDCHAIDDDYVQKVMGSDIHAEQIKMLLRMSVLEDVQNFPNKYMQKHMGQGDGATSEYVYSSTVYDHAYLVDSYIHDQYLKDNPEFENVHVCDFCGSDNVQTKAWVRPNQNNLFVDIASEEINDNYCDDCDQNSCLTVVKKNVRHSVIGFQVWGDDGTAQDGEMHPHMDASFCVYSLDQANSMMDDDNNGDEQWKLMAIWTDTVEEPTMMFETDPRG